ncbi:hypothetical protein RhiirA1_483412 [Rhizophagus irregularis]|uniref:Uncharacterized protein n=1 Tax=Rhizophagus irregularis TaxID=588596 RepID=A0A2N0QKJ7_9GLOM|nr:hypothetical protein RhiirA1_483412 [Rhizophagus irregularis]
MLFTSFGQLESKSYYVNVVGADGAGYEVESKDLMKDHWNYSCFKTETITIAPPARQEMISPTSYQSLNCKSNTSEIFILSLYAKQNNLLGPLPYAPSARTLSSINHLNQPTLRLKDGTKITIV